MTPGELEAIVKRYAISHFWKVLRKSDCITVDQKLDLKKNPPSKQEVLESLLANVEQAKRDITATEARYRRAQLDGLLDMDVYKLADKKLKPHWLAAIETVKGDVARSHAELAHWREYAKIAIEDKLPMWTPGADVIASLAATKSVERLGQTDEEANQARRKIAADLAAWQARNPPEEDQRLPPEREPGEDDDLEAAF